MIEWTKIKIIENEDVRKFLGKNFYAMNGEGYYARVDINDLYIIEGGNGFIIQIHNYPYVIAIIHRNPIPTKDNPLSQDIEIDDRNNKHDMISIYAIHELKGMADRELIMQNFKQQLEREFRSFSI